jgi:hypothetical protein
LIFKNPFVKPKNVINNFSVHLKEYKMKKETSGPAFPVPPNTWYDKQGMTLRDYFAAKAMQGLLAADTGFTMSATQIAEHACVQADAMLKAREQ